MRSFIRRAFAPLSIPNYRRFFVGQVFARCGSWVQAVAEIWLVLSLTGSGVSLGLTTALQFAPMLVLGALGGRVGGPHAPSAASCLQHRAGWSLPRWPCSC